MVEFRYSSENYQIINYGLGGSFSTHRDWVNDSGVGGGRVATALIYLSTVEAGGFTVFPELGLSLKPTMGNVALFNVAKSDGATDTR